MVLFHIVFVVGLQQTYTMHYTLQPTLQATALIDLFDAQNSLSLIISKGFSCGGAFRYLFKLCRKFSKFSQGRSFIIKSLGLGRASGLPPVPPGILPGVSPSVVCFRAPNKQP